MLDKADGSIYNEVTANTDEVFAAGRRWNGRSSAGQASCLPEKGLVLHGRTAGPEGMGMKQNRPCRLVCVLCALAFALTALPIAQQPEETAAVQQSLTAADVRGMQQADAAVTELTDSEDYTRMSEDERIDAALQQLEELTRQGLVKQGSVYTDAENGMVSFTYSCGALGGVLVEDPDEENTPFAPSELPAVDLHEMSNAPQGDLGSAMIYYAFDNTVNSSRYPYYSYMKGFWTAMGLHTRIDTTVTVSDLKRMNDYGLCILSAHGSYYTYTSGFLFKQTRTEPVILLTEESDFYKDLYYGIDLLTHRVIKINGLYCITPSFFRAAYRGGQLKDTVVLSETCVPWRERQSGYLHGRCPAGRWCQSSGRLCEQRLHRVFPQYAVGYRQSPDPGPDPAGICSALHGYLWRG